jgi:biotin operon repressor
MSDDPTPGRKPRVTDDEILEVLRASDDPVLSTAEVTEQLPIKRSATYKRLNALREDGRLIGKEIGGRNTVWWVSDDTTRS